LTEKQKNSNLKPEEEKLIRIIRETGYGEISYIRIREGKPTLVEVKKTIKLD